jgi:methionine-gamma-lyase
LLLHSAPLYGGTHHFIHHFLTGYGINVMSFTPAQSIGEVEEMLIESGMHERLAMILIETPANPTNDVLDIGRLAEMAGRLSKPDRKVYLAVDNTYMGPLWQHPLKHGADLVLYSATKYIGGHSDVIAGAVLGNEELIHRVKVLRTFLGNMISPHSGWLLLRSLETLKVRMEQQALNAQEVAAFLHHHPKISRVHFPAYLHETNPEQYHVFKKQCTSAGAMVSFDIAGGEKEAFTFLNSLKLIKLAVSLGSTESLAEHPATMTHVDIPEEDKRKMKVTPSLVRISVGIENYKDIIWDIEQALEKVKVPEPLALI